MPKPVMGVLSRAKKRKKMTAIERLKFIRDRAKVRAKAEASNKKANVATDEEFNEMLDDVFKGGRKDKKNGK